MRWNTDVDLEETPAMYKDPFTEAATGNSSSCYVCSRSFANLASEYRVRRDHTYNPDPKSLDTRKYFMTYCVWCAFQYEL